MDWYKWEKCDYTKGIKDAIFTLAASQKFQKNGIKKVWFPEAVVYGDLTDVLPDTSVI